MPRYGRNSLYVQNPIDLKDHVRSLSGQTKRLIRAIRATHHFRGLVPHEPELFDELLKENLESLEQLEAELERQALR